MKRRLVAAVVIIATALAGCTKKPTTVVSTTDSTVTSTVTATRTPSTKPFTPPPATTVAPLPPGAAPARGEVEKRCPYIASSPDQDPNVNVADIEGDHVYRTTVLTSYQPVGCRFYFYAGPFEAIADIQPYTFASATEAHNAMVLTAQAGSEQLTDHVATGVDGILYRTTFFGPDGKRDWACAFAKGKHLVVVHTQRDDTSRNALYIAQAIAGKF